MQNDQKQREYRKQDFLRVSSVFRKVFWAVTKCAAKALGCVHLGVNVGPVVYFVLQLNSASPLVYMPDPADISLRAHVIAVKRVTLRVFEYWYHGLCKLTIDFSSQNRSTETVVSVHRALAGCFDRLCLSIPTLLVICHVEVQRAHLVVESRITLKWLWNLVLIPHDVVCDDTLRSVFCCFVGHS